MQQDRTARRALAPHPHDNVDQVFDTAQADEALRRVTGQPAQRADDWYTTAARAAHNLHCTHCRELTATSNAAAAANTASIQRRDRKQLGLRTSVREVTV
ncbi:hypothetical protein ACWEGQ_00410 [Streptomyces seoulensis]